MVRVVVIIVFDSIEIRIRGQLNIEGEDKAAMKWRCKKNVFMPIGSGLWFKTSITLQCLIYKLQRTRLLKS